MNPNDSKILSFSFDELASGAALKILSKYFAQAGNPVVTSAVDPRPKRSSGISYKEILLTFADSQTVTLRVKQTGDIFEVLLNGTMVPIKNQGDPIQAVAEVSGMLERGRTKFQQKLAKALVKLPKEIHTAAPKLLTVLTQKRDDLKTAIAAIDEEIPA